MLLPIICILYYVFTFGMYFKAGWSGFSKCAFLSHLCIHPERNKSVSSDSVTFPCDSHRWNFWLGEDTKMSWALPALRFQDSGKNSKHKGGKGG